MVLRAGRVVGCLVLALTLSLGCGGGSKEGETDAGHEADGTTVGGDTGGGGDGGAGSDGTVSSDSGGADVAVDSTVHDAEIDSGVADEGVDATPQDSALIDSSVADSATLDSTADTGIPETGTADTALPDTSTLDSGMVDAGAMDSSSGLDAAEASSGADAADAGSDAGLAVESGAAESGAPEAGADATAGYTVEASVSGLAAGDTLALDLNGGDTLFVNQNSNAVFSNTLATGASFSVTVVGDPTAPIPESCSVTNGTGTVGTSDVSGIHVACVVTGFTIGGTVTGLQSGSTIQLTDNGTDNLTVTGTSAASVPFTFNQLVTTGQMYAVTTAGQTGAASPIPETCVVSSGGSGTVSGGNVTNVQVTCTPNQYCASIIAANPAAANGAYVIDPTLAPNAGFQTYCDLTTFGGGWALALNLDTSDGHVMWWGNTAWTDSSTFGTTTSPYAADFKGNAWNSYSGAAKILVLIHQQGSPLGWKVFAKTDGSTLFQDLQGGDNTLIGSSVLSSNVSNAILTTARERLVRLSTSLYANHCVQTNGTCTIASGGLPDGDRIGSNEATPEDNNGGALGNWHDMGYCCGGPYGVKTCNGSAFRTTAEAQIDWGSAACNYCPYGCSVSNVGMLGSDSFAPVNPVCNDSTCADADWSSMSGYDFDYAIFLGN